MIKKCIMRNLFENKLPGTYCYYFTSRIQLLLLKENLVIFVCRCVFNIFYNFVTYKVNCNTL